MKAFALTAVLAALCLHAGGYLATSSQGCRSSPGPRVIRRQPGGLMCQREVLTKAVCLWPWRQPG